VPAERDRHDLNAARRSCRGFSESLSGSVTVPGRRRRQTEYRHVTARRPCELVIRDETLAATSCRSLCGQPGDVWRLRVRNQAFPPAPGRRPARRGWRCPGQPAKFKLDSALMLPEHRAAWSAAVAFPGPCRPAAGPSQTCGCLVGRRCPGPASAASVF
jgi:hypothetical protein